MILNTIHIQTQMSTARVSEQVKAWRTAKGLTLQAAAMRIGVAIATLFQWEAGTSLPSPMAVPALAGVLSKDPAALAGLVARERSRRLVGRAGHRGGSCPRRTGRGRS